MTEQLPVAAQAQLRAALDTAMSQPTVAQGFLTNIPDLGGLKGKVGPILDTAIGALDTLLGYRWLIPDQYEAPLDKLLQALKKVQGWLA
jgi:hypothetical protein